MSKNTALLWEDNFSYEGLPDARNWTYEHGFVRNKELQYYTEGRLENARVEDGHLVLEARRERLANSAFDPGATAENWLRKRRFTEITSASLHTKHSCSFQYGTVESRLRVPTGLGIWPALWMMPTRPGESPWPDCGEIDIMEYVGHDPGNFHATIHTGAYNHLKLTQKGDKLPISEPWREFHTFRCEWTPDALQFFCDDTPVFRYDKPSDDPAEWPFDQPFHLKVNLAFGGFWGAQEGVDETLLPLRYEIDYIRVFRNADTRM